MRRFVIGLSTVLFLLAAGAEAGKVPLDLGGTTWFGLTGTKLSVKGAGSDTAVGQLLVSLGETTWSAESLSGHFYSGAWSITGTKVVLTLDGAGTAEMEKMIAEWIESYTAFPVDVTLLDVSIVGKVKARNGALLSAKYQIKATFVGTGGMETRGGKFQEKGLLLPI
ncbi:MAG: hypothetical protein MUE73_05350 [Planctomycetes bacterium]|jgi:hypothetical protein|nr:hypothetical protein [Planctomycetota bacterium]